MVAGIFPDEATVIQRPLATVVFVERSFCRGEHWDWNGLGTLIAEAEGRGFIYRGEVKLGHAQLIFVKPHFQCPNLEAEGKVVLIAINEDEDGCHLYFFDPDEEVPEHWTVFSKLDISALMADGTTRETVLDNLNEASRSWQP